MSNMSYCRFENTLGDLIDCQEHLNSEVDSESEAKSRLELVDICRQIVAEYEMEDEDENFGKEPEEEEEDEDLEDDDEDDNEEDE